MKITTQNLPDFYRTRSVGFDRLFEEMDRAFTNSVNTGYPPYNIVRVADNEYLISIAVAGFTMDDLSVTKDGNSLVVTGTSPQADNVDVEYLHKGIAGRNFERKYQLADHVEVTEAKLDLGVLNITLTQELPEALKPKTIKIKS